MKNFFFLHIPIAFFILATWQRQKSHHQESIAICSWVTLWDIEKVLWTHCSPHLFSRTPLRTHDFVHLSARASEPVSNNVMERAERKIHAELSSELSHLPNLPPLETHSKSLENPLANRGSSRRCRFKYYRRRRTKKFLPDTIQRHTERARKANYFMKVCEMNWKFFSLWSEQTEKDENSRESMAVGIYVSKANEEMRRKTHRQCGAGGDSPTCIESTLKLFIAAVSHSRHPRDTMTSFERALKLILCCYKSQEHQSDDTW